MAKNGIGARLKRKEDDRHLRGRGVEHAFFAASGTFSPDFSARFNSVQ